MLAIFDVEGVLYDAEYLPILAEKVNKEDEIHFIQCFVCTNFQSRVMGNVLCKGDALKD